MAWHSTPLYPLHLMEAVLALVSEAVEVYENLGEVAAVQHIYSGSFQDHLLSFRLEQQKEIHLMFPRAVAWESPSHLPAAVSVVASTMTQTNATQEELAE